MSDCKVVAEGIDALSQPMHFDRLMYPGAKKKPLGEGSRFAALQHDIAQTVHPRPGQTKEEAAGAIAASIGRKKYGAAKMASWAAKGR